MNKKAFRVAKIREKYNELYGMVVDLQTDTGDDPDLTDIVEDLLFVVSDVDTELDIAEEFVEQLKKEEENV